MDHSEAIKTKAAERYLLNELSAADREAYEDHYFSCPECAEDLKAGAVLIANTREVLRSQPVVASKRHLKMNAVWSWSGWFRPAWAMAAIVLLALILYQSLVTIPRVRQQVAQTAPQVLPSFSFVTLGSRGGSELVIKVNPDEPFGLYLDVPSNPKFASYTCEVLTPQGTSKFSVVIPGQKAQDTVQLLIPGSTLPAGQYELVVRGNRDGEKHAPGNEVVRYPFVVSNAQ